jgi:hypothetical protein
MQWLPQIIRMTSKPYGSRGRSHPPDIAGRLDQKLGRAVICLNDIAQEPSGAILDIIRQQPFTL